MFQFARCSLFVFKFLLVAMSSARSFTVRYRGTLYRETVSQQPLLFALLRDVLLSSPCVAQQRLTHNQFDILWAFAARRAQMPPGCQSRDFILLREHIGRRLFQWNVPSDFYFEALLQTYDFLSQPEIMNGSLSLVEFRHRSDLVKSVEPMKLFVSDVAFPIPLELLEPLSAWWTVVEELLQHSWSSQQFEVIWNSLLAVASSEADAPFLCLEVKYLNQLLTSVRVPRPMYVHATVLLLVVRAECLRRQLMPLHFQHIFSVVLERFLCGENKRIDHLLHTYTSRSVPTPLESCQLQPHAGLAARDLLPLASDILCPLANCPFTASTSSYVCQWCGQQCLDATEWQVHISTHAGSVTSPVSAQDYRTSVLSSHAFNWPCAISSNVQSWCLAQCQAKDADIIQKPQIVCPVCAQATAPASMTTLTLPCASDAFQQFHVAFSASQFLQRVCRQFECMQLSDSFEGLSWAALYSTCVPIPSQCFPFLPDEAAADAWLFAKTECASRVSFANDNLLFECCDVCALSLSENPLRLPPVALANGQWVGDVPDALQGLSVGESMFICRGFTFRRLKHLQNKGDPQSRQLALTGGTIAFPQDGAQLLNILPASPHFVAEHFLVSFTSEDGFASYASRNLRVRRARVHAALTWLQRHNPFYSDVALSPEALLALPVDDVPSAFRDFAFSSDVPLQQHSGPVDATLHVSNATPLDAIIVDSSFADIPALSLWKQALGAAADATQALNDGAVEGAAASSRAALDSVHALLNSTENPEMIQAEAAYQGQILQTQLPHGSAPLDSYLPGYWSYCHPTLFPYGLGVDGLDRPVSLNDRGWARSLLLRADRMGSHAWSRDLEFVASLYSIMLRRRLLRSVRARVRTPMWKHSVQELQSLTAVDFARVYSTLGDHDGVQAAFFFL